MGKTFQTKAFGLGFLGGLVLFLSANFYHFNKMYWQSCFDCTQDRGVPFLLYRSGGFFDTDHILWFGLIANILIAIAVSTIIGLVFYFIATKLRKLPPLE